MNPKEKAKELIALMCGQIGTYTNSLVWGIAKNCSMVCVDELISDCDASSPFEIKRLEYWKQVKTEINNL